MPSFPPTPPSASPQPWSRLGVLALMAIIGFTAVIRGAAMFNDLWLDEVFSLRNVTALKSAGGVFTEFLSDNNHPLISLWMRLVGPTPQEWLYRLPSWLAGIAAVWLAAEIARAQFARLRPEASPSQGEIAALATAVLVGGAYLLTVYFSEARGYGIAVACALLALLALLRDPGGESWRWTMGHWLACGAGLLAHAVTVQVMLGAAAWSLVRLLREENKGRALLAAARWHAVPFAFAAIYYLGFVRHLGIGGGPETTALAVLGETVSTTFGLPALTFAVILIALVAAIVWLWRRAPEIAALHATTIVIAPLAMLAFSRFSLLFPRYLIVSSVGALLLAGYFVAVAWSQGRAGRIAAGAVLAGVVAGNVLPTLDLLRHGRGDFRAVLRHLAASTPTPEISVCSDHDNRTLPMLLHYAPTALAGRPLRYVRGNEPRPHAARWLLVHKDASVALGPEVRDPAGNTFTLEARFPHAPLSGWDWLVYRDRTFPAP